MADFILTQDQLAKMIPGNQHVSYWYDALSACLPDYDINSVQRMAAFIAQCAHESANFTTVVENLNYKAETLMKTWPSRFPNMDIANQYAHNQQAIANKAYASRMGNGDENSGDGYRYCGRGLIQITGKENYQKFADSISTPVEQITDFIVTFEGAVQSAAWFWESRDLNNLADIGDIDTMTKKINGGTLGIDDRKARYSRALQIFGDQNV
jgi:putative chitinase